jgi:hypothetical protein
MFLRTYQILKLFSFKDHAFTCVELTEKGETRRGLQPEQRLS